MIALDDLVELLLVIAQQPPSGVQTWIASGADAYSTREIYDLLRATHGKRKGVEWLPRWVWRLGASLVDRISRNSGEPTFDKLFGTELYSNAAVVNATGWHPHISLESAMREWRTGRGSDL